MADNGPSYNLAAIVGSGYGVGREIGNDFSRNRLSSKDKKLREEIAAKFPDMDTDEEQAAAAEAYYKQNFSGSSAARGANRRDLQLGQRRTRNRDGEDSYEGGTPAVGSYTDNFSGERTQAIKTRAGKMVADGQVPQAQRLLGRSQALRGDVEAGGANLYGADRAEALQIGDAGQRAKAMQTAAAKYGDEKGESEAVAKMNQVANTLYGRAAVIYDQNPQEALALINQALQYDSRWGTGLSARFDNANNSINLYAGDPDHLGKIVSHIPMEQAGEWLRVHANAPDELLASASAAAAEKQKLDAEQQRKMDGELSKAHALLATEFFKVVGNERDAAQLTKLGTDMASANVKAVGGPEEYADQSLGIAGTAQKYEGPGGVFTVVYNRAPGGMGEGDAGGTIILDSNHQVSNRSAIDGAAQAEAFTVATGRLNTASFAKLVQAYNFSTAELQRAYGRDVPQYDMGDGGEAAPSGEAAPGAAPGASSGTGVQTAVDLILGLESNGNPKAKNTRSSATGAGQFIEETWLRLLPQAMDTSGMDRAKMLALRNDPNLSREMTTLYAAENGNALLKAGLQDNAANIYLAHHFGKDGAIKILYSDPNTKLFDVISEKARKANPSYAGKTVAQVGREFNARTKGKLGSFVFHNPEFTAAINKPATPKVAVGSSPETQAKLDNVRIGFIGRAAQFAGRDARATWDAAKVAGSYLRDRSAETEDMLVSGQKANYDTAIDISNGLRSGWKGP